MVTLKEMIKEGWKPRVINGVRVLQNSEYGILAKNGKGGKWSADDLIQVALKLGRPDKTHTLGGEVTTLEYFELYQEVAS